MWHNGSVAEAVSASKRSGQALLIFIRSDDLQPDSELMEEHFNSEEVRSVCEKSGLIALRLSKGSESALQFGQIYPVVAIPITFLIDSNGTPLEIIAGKTTKEELVNRLNKGLKLKSEKNAAVASASLQKTPETEETAKSTNSASSIEDRVERARDLLNQRRIERSQAEIEEEKEKERQRREQGRLVAKTQKELEEKAMIDAAEERRRQKKADALHLQRLREEIARDRAEKQAKFQNVQEEAKEVRLEKQKKSLEESLAEQAARNNIAKIQFRLPDGSCVNTSFEADALFSEAVEFIHPKANEFGEYQLIQMYPRKEFSSEDHDRTFRQLYLSPSGVLMIMPKTSRQVKKAENGFWALWALVIAPFLWLYRILGFGGMDRPTPNNQSDRSDGGGVHRMTERKDENGDKEARWNGNSTQQL